jgi:hypothetical protein
MQLIGLKDTDLRMNLNNYIQKRICTGNKEAGTDDFSRGMLTLHSSMLVLMVEEGNQKSALGY